MLSRPIKPVAALLALVIATMLLYWPGLHGPFLFDDFWNLAPIEYWYIGVQDWKSALFPGQTIIDSRPVAMASFMASLSLGGAGPFPLKLGNLIVHIACGLLIWQLALQLLRRDEQLRTQANTLALLATGVWLLHPLHVSTVLYVVQRMAQLSTLFTLMALLAYIKGRTTLSEGRTPPTLLWLFVIFPILVALGLLSKQNAAIAGLLCACIEYFYFRRSRAEIATVGIFTAFFSITPLLFVVGLLIIAPEALLANYKDMDFDVYDRLLTQPAVLVDYIQSWVIPFTPSMGLYFDDFPITKSPFTYSFLVPMLVLSALTFTAFRLRTISSSIPAGWVFFLIAHSIESSFLPLEMHYEHRNYLPSIGLLISLIALMSNLLALLDGKSANSRVIKGIVAIGFVSVLCVGTLGRVLVWQHKESIMLQGVTYHPNSIRAVVEYSSLLMSKNQFSVARAALVPVASNEDARLSQIAKLQLIALDCASLLGSDRAAIIAATRDAPPVLSVYEVQAIRLFTRLNEKTACGTLDAGAMADGFLQLLAAADAQPESSANKAAVRKSTSQLLARAGRWREAQEQALLAWEGVGDGATAALLVSYYLATLDVEQARNVLSDLKQRVREHDLLAQAEIARLERSVEHAGE